MLIDSHCHLNSLKKSILEEVISKASGHYFIDSSIDIESSQISTALSNKYDFVYSSLGFHPFSAKSFSKELLSEYERLILANEKVVAVGEIGLDHTAKISLQIQEVVLGNFIELAEKIKKPIIIHNRMQDARILDILDKSGFDYKRVVFHCFSCSSDFLERVTKKGAFVSFSLNILRKNKDIVGSLLKCPLENILLETDSPYMRVNKLFSTALDIIKTYEFAASVKSLEMEELEKIVLNNAQKLFFKKEEL